MVKLFAVYLGGYAKGCNIELHDVVFIVGPTIEATFPRLLKKWFSYPDKAHMDAFIELKHIDGYEIRLVENKPSDNPFKLFFVNFGAYTENLFGEIHQCAFYVAKTKAEAIKKAQNNLCVKMLQRHVDDNLEVSAFIQEEFEVDDILELDFIDGYHLDFTPLEEEIFSLPVPGYRKLVKEVVS